MAGITNIISHNFHSKYFRAVNKCRTLLGMPLLRDYKLISKADKINVSELDKNVWESPENAFYYSLVRVGKNSDPKFSREIITFYDERNKLIQRIFRQNGLNTRLKLYKDSVMTDEKRSRLVTTKEFVQSEQSAGKSIPDRLENFLGSWKTNVEEFQIIKKYPHLRKDSKISPVGLFTKKTEYLSGITDSIRNITFTKYPINHGIENPYDKKVISGTVIKSSEDFQLKDIYISDNLRLDLKDKFLKYRFIDPRSDEGAILLTQYFLNQKGLKPLEVLVCPSMSSHFVTGSFNKSGTIYYSEDFFKQSSYEVVDTIAHEVEHAYQYAQIGRLGKVQSRYEAKANLMLPPLEFEELDEAVKYSIARDVYPRKNYVASNPAYWSNYLEVKAREAGAKATEEYQACKNNYSFFEEFSAG